MILWRLVCGGVVLGCSRDSVCVYGEDWLGSGFRFSYREFWGFCLGTVGFRGDFFYYFYYLVFFWMAEFFCFVLEFYLGLLCE